MVLLDAALSCQEFAAYIITASKSIEYGLLIGGIAHRTQ
jgi:hypothetical protein